MSTFIHPLSDVQSQNIGEGTRIWQYFCVVLHGVEIGEGCVVGAGVKVLKDAPPHATILDWRG